MLWLGLICIVLGCIMVGMSWTADAYDYTTQIFGGFYGGLALILGSIFVALSIHYGV